MSEGTQHPNAKIAQRIFETGNKLQFDLLRNEAQRDEFAKQGQLSSYMLTNTFKRLSDPSDPADERAALADVIKRGNKLGIPPQVSIGLFKSTAETVDRGAKRAGLANKAYLDAILKTTQATKGGLDIIKKQQDIEKEEGIPLIRSSLGKLQREMRRVANEKTFESKVDALGNKEFTTEGGFLSAGFGNLAKTPAQLAHLIANQLVQKSPELASKINITKIESMALKIINNPDIDLKKLVLETTGLVNTEDEDAPAPDLIDDIITQSAGR